MQEGEGFNTNADAEIKPPVVATTSIETKPPRFLPPPPLFDKEDDAISSGTSPALVVTAHPLAFSTSVNKKPTTSTTTVSKKEGSTLNASSSSSNALGASSLCSSMDKAASILMRPVVSMYDLRSMSRKGLSERHRATYWKLLLGHLPLESAKWESTLAETRKNYDDILHSVLSFNDLGQLVVSHEDTNRIDVDIPRTIPNLHFFALPANEETVMEKGVPVTFSLHQQSLRRVLHLFAKLNPGLGYVQGMNEIVGHLLFTFVTEKPVGSDGQYSKDSDEFEGDVFFCFQKLMTLIGDNFCRALDQDHDTGVSSSMYVYSRLLYYCDEELFAYLGEMHIQPEFYAFRWITLVLTQEFCLPDVLRLWDFLFSFGDQLGDALFFTAVSMIMLVRDFILEESFNIVLPLLQSYPPNVDIEEIVILAEELMQRLGLQLPSLIRMRQDDEEEIKGGKRRGQTLDQVKEKASQFAEVASTKWKGFMGMMKNKMKNLTTEATPVQRDDE